MTPSANPISAQKAKWDPQNADFVIRYEKSHFWKNEEGGTADVYQLVAILIALVAFPMRSRWGFWLALFFYYTSCINTDT